MAQFGREVSQLAVQNKFRPISFGRPGLGPVWGTAEQKGGDIGRGLGKGMGDAFARAMDPEVQRRRGMETINMLLRTPINQREIIIQNPQVQKQLKKYSRYLPMAFEDAYRLDNTKPHLEGYLTVVDDKYFEQKYTAGQAQIAETEATTGVKGAQTKAIAQQTKQEDELFNLLLRSKELGIEHQEEQLRQMVKDGRLTDAQAARLRGEEKRDKELQPGRVQAQQDEGHLKAAQAANLAADTETEDLLRQGKAEALAADTALNDARAKHLGAQTSELSETSVTLEKARLAQIDKEVQGSIDFAQKGMEALGEKLKFSITPEKDLALGYAQIASSLARSMKYATIKDAVGGGDVSIPRILTNAEMFNVAHQALSKAFEAVMYHKDELTPEDLTQIYQATEDMFTETYDKARAYRDQLPPDVADFIFGRNFALPFHQMNYIDYWANRDKMTPKERAQAEQDLQIGGMLEIQAESNMERLKRWFGGDSD